MNRTIGRRIAAAALVPLAVVSVGCGKAAEKVGEKAAEKAAENALEQQGGGKVDIDSKDGSVKIESKDGTYQSDGDGNFKYEGKDGTVQGGEGLPADWQKDIEFPDGVKVMFGTSTPQGISVTFTSSDSAQEVFDDFASKLDGWDVKDKTSMDMDSGAVRSAKFIDGERTMSVSVTDSSSGSSGTVFLETKGSN